MNSVTPLHYIDYMQTPVGLLEIQASEKGISRVIFCESKNSESTPNSHTQNCKQQLEEYFAGKRQTFDLPLDQVGTKFQQQVWHCLLQLPFGTSASYGQIANMMDNPKAVRAVGAANGKNPISIIVPCHRVIGQNGTLTGYAGGLTRKAWLLNHENISYRELATK